MHVEVLGSEILYGQIMLKYFSPQIKANMVSSGGFY